MSEIQVIEPATEQVMAEVPRAGTADVDASVARAKEAYPAWRAVVPEDRAALLHGPPGGERVLRPGHRGIDVVGAGAVQLCKHLLGCGLDDLDQRAASSEGAKGDR